MRLRVAFYRMDVESGSDGIIVLFPSAADPDHGVNTVEVNRSRGSVTLAESYGPLSEDDLESPGRMIRCLREAGRR
jgi:hypothetical protein